MSKTSVLTIELNRGLKEQYIKLEDLSNADTNILLMALMKTYEEYHQDYKIQYSGISYESKEYDTLQLVVSQDTYNKFVQLAQANMLTYATLLLRLVHVYNETFDKSKIKYLQHMCECMNLKGAIYRTVSGVEQEYNLLLKDKQSLKNIKINATLDYVFVWGEHICEIYSKGGKYLYYKYLMQNGIGSEYKIMSKSELIDFIIKADVLSLENAQFFLAYFKGSRGIRDYIQEHELINEKNINEIAEYFHEKQIKF